MKKDDFENWVFLKTGKSIPDNPFFEACVSDAVELFNNSKINGISFEDHFPLDDQMKSVFESFQSRVSILLSVLSPGVNIVFRGVPLIDYLDDKDMLLFQLSQLSVEY